MPRGATRAITGRGGPRVALRPCRAEAHNPPMTTPAMPVPGRVEEQTPETRLEPLYHLVLLDDDDHSYAYVIEMLGKVFGYAKEKAYVLACIVDGEGRVVVETAGHEQVERHQQQIHAF